MIDPSRVTAQQRATSEWASFAARLRTVTPRGLARAALTLAVVGAAAAVAAGSWSVLVPFAVGGLIAYVLMPAVDVLARAMPRVVAATLAMVGVVAALVAALVIVVPPLASGLIQLAAEVPGSSELAAAAARLEDRLGNLPAGSREIVLAVLDAVATTFRGIVSGVSGGLDEAVPSLAHGLLQSVGALLGLIVLPTWMLAAMTEKQRIRRALDARLAPWLRRDVWAGVAIADRAAGAYLRGYVVAAVFVGILAYAGVAASPRFGGPTFPEPVALGVFAGLVQVIPIVGPLLGFVPGVLLLAVDQDRAVTYLGVYVVAQLVGTRLVGARLMQRRLGVHPLLFVPSVLVVGQVGLAWLLLSAPIVTFVADVVRYLHGRLSEPPTPAGVLPRTAEWAAASGVAPAPARFVRRRATAPRPLSVAPPANAPPG